MLIWQQIDPVFSARAGHVLTKIVWDVKDRLPLVLIKDEYDRWDGFYAIDRPLVPGQLTASIVTATAGYDAMIGAIARIVERGIDRREAERETPRP